MRYIIMSKTLTLSQLQDEVRKCGGRNIKAAPASRQVFADLEPAGAEKVGLLPDTRVKGVSQVKAAVMTSVDELNMTRRLGNMYAQQPTYAASQSSIASHYFQFRDAFTPPLIGAGWTVAILDSGIRKTHVGLVDKVVYEKNFTESPTVKDLFSHGTGVAYLCAGGRHLAGEESGLAPGVTLMNIKVLNDEGIGTDETLILGIEDVIRLKEEAIKQGLPLTDPMYPRAINMSLGAPDDGDPDNPLRLAAKACKDAGIAIVASAGNGGPAASSITLPAACETVIAVGAANFYPFSIADYSSRGPTPDGLIKPDWVWYGMNILTADAASDEAFTIKNGTSFSAPAIAGGWALLYEATLRRGITTPGGEEIPKEVLEEMLAPYAIKPEGAPAEKDNTYGYGQPDGILVGRALGVRMPGVIPAWEETLTPILSLAMMGMVMGSMAKGFR